MTTSTLITTLFDETINSDVHVEIEWEYTSEPNGKPDPADSYSEGYDIVPELLSVKIVEVVNPPKEMDEDLYMGWQSNFENKNWEEAKEILNDYVDGLEEEDEHYYEEDV